MRVSEALKSRITCRAFLSTPVREETIREIISAASRAPSGGNLQPWHVWALAGTRLEALRALIRERMKTDPFGEGAEYKIYPEGLKEPYRSRRFKCGEDMYALVGIPRENKPARLKQFAHNYDFFGAPVGLFFAIDRTMGQDQWADLGMFMQSIMLMAREKGLHTAAQEAWAIWHKTLQAFLPIPEEQMFFCGMALGHMDQAHPINRLRTERANLDEFARFEGF